MDKTVERIQAMLEGNPHVAPVGALVGMRATAIADGRAVFELEAGERHHNPMGTVHGGVLCDLADAAMGMAYASVLEEGESFTTLELKANFLRPVREGLLRAEAEVVKGGRQVGFVQCDVTDAEGRLVARVTSTCLTLRGGMARGR